MDSLKNKITFFIIFVLIACFMVIKILYGMVGELESNLKIANQQIATLEKQNNLINEVYNSYQKEMEGIKDELETYKQKYQYLEEDKDAKAYLDTYIPNSVDNSIPR